MMWSGFLFFIIISTSCGGSASQRLYCEFTSWKNKVYLIEGDAWVYSKTLQHSLSLSFMACDKNWLFLILYGKYQMFLCTNCLIRNSDAPISWAIELIVWLGLLSIIARISPTYLGVFYQNNQSEAFKLLYLCNHHWTRSTLFESLALF